MKQLPFGNPILKTRKLHPKLNIPQQQPKLNIPQHSKWKKHSPHQLSTTTDKQPIELDTSISEIIKETIPSVLIPNDNDEILITVRQPFRSTSWIWSSTKKGRIQVRWQIPFVDVDYGRTQCMDGDKKCQDDYHKRKLHYRR